MFVLEEFLLGCARDFEKAANGTKHSEAWRKDMARRSGFYYGRYFALKLGVEGKLKLKPMSMEEATKIFKPIEASAASLAALAKDPKYAEKVKIRL